MVFGRIKQRVISELKERKMQKDRAKAAKESKTAKVSPADEGDEGGGTGASSGEGGDAGLVSLEALARKKREKKKLTPEEERLLEGQEKLVDLIAEYERPLVKSVKQCAPHPLEGWTRPEAQAL